MKLFVLLMTVISADKALITNDKFEISLNELHVSLYDLDDEKKFQAFSDVKYIDVILTKLLNYDYAYDYVLSHGINTNQAFIDKNNEVAETSQAVAYADYLADLGISEEQFRQLYYQHLLKKEYFFLLEDYFMKSLDSSAIEKYTQQSYAVIKPKDADLHVLYTEVVELPQSQYKAEEVIAFLEQQLADDSKANFKANIEKLAKTEPLNSNEIKLKKDSQFNLPFVADLYTTPAAGTVAKLFEYDGNYYVARIHEIDRSGKEHYFDFKQKRLNDLADEQVKMRMQNVINTYTQNGIDVNQEAVTKLLDSYAQLTQ